MRDFDRHISEWLTRHDGFTEGDAQRLARTIRKANGDNTTKQARLCAINRLCASTRLVCLATDRPGRRTVLRLAYGGTVTLAHLH